MNPVEKKQSEFFDELLESIKPNSDEFIKRRIHHIPFATTIVWLSIESRKRNVFYLDELRRFLQVEESRAYFVLKNLVESGYLKKTKGKREYFFIRDEIKKIAKITEFFDEACKTLGKKPKKQTTYTFENEEESYL